MKAAAANAAPRSQAVSWVLFAFGLVLVMIGFLSPGRSVQPKALSCEPSVLQSNAAKWVLLTNCQLDLAGALAPETPGKRPARLHVPVRPLNETGAAPALLISTNPINIATFLQLRSLTNSSAARSWIQHHLEMTFPQRDVRAIVRQRAGKERTLGSIPEGMAPNYVVLEEAGTSRKSKSVLWLVAGGVVALTGLFLALRIRDSNHSKRAASL